MSGYRTRRLSSQTWLSNLPDLSCITDECEGDKENLFDERAAPVSVLPCTSLGSSNTPKRLRLSLARPSKEATTVAEYKPTFPPLKEENRACAQSIPQSFSGSFTNCTINISL